MGIPDFTFLLSSDIMMGPFSMALSTLPTMTLFAKITPVGIEATMFAFFTGVFNF